MALGPITPRQVILLTSAAVGAAVAALGLTFFLIAGDTSHLYLVAVLMIAAFAAAYVATAYGLKRFIQERIRTIYKAVQGLRDRAPEKPVDLDQDVLGEVNEEVMDWARARRSEINELREREKFRREFIGNLSHELKTPIFNIQGYILTLLEGGLEDEKVNRDFLHRASNGVERLIKLVEDLDMITKLESGVMELNVKRMDLNALVKEIVESMEMKAKARGIAIRNQLPPNLMVMADRDRLAQVFINLFTNAINYGREGGRCRVGADDLEDQVLVEVSDDGIGISAEHLPRLFERFYRVGKSRSRNEGGSGLGLAIVKHIIDAHGQTITVKSREGEGSTFVFTLKKAR
ncbi:MAG: sensor histidine kinase [Flavobacteriales bacterium]|nr:sensor histidine kinase [Flavobacteriales bacterium]